MEIIKTTTKIYKVLEITRKPFMKFKSYKEAKERNKLHVQRTCFKCNKKFLEEDDIYLAITNKGTRLLCKKCAKNAMNDLNKTTNSVQCMKY